MVPSLHNVTVSYDRHPALHHVSGAFAQGALTAIAGPNGAGKSTLLKALLGLVPIEHGRIEMGNLAREDIAYMPQALEITRDFPVTVAPFLALAFFKKAGWFGGISAAQRRQIEAALADVGLAGFGKRSLQSLSVGQFQRVLFARVMLQDAKLILLDEPFAAVDAEAQDRLVKVVKEWGKQGRTVLCVLHDPVLIRAVFPHCLLLARDLVAWGRADEVLTADNAEKLNHFGKDWTDKVEVCHP